MDVISRIITGQLEISVMGIVLALGAGIGIFVLFAALVVPARGKPKTVKATVMRARSRFGGIQAQLDQAQMEISADEYVKRSLTFGIPVGIGLFVLVGSIVLFFVGIIAGFMITWTKLEQERDKKTVKYTKQLASACDTIRTAYGVNPSLKKALEAVAEYGQPPVRDDFQEILVAASQERFIEGLQQVADRRRSIVFDTVATSLIRASEASGEVGEMLQRLAESTRQNVASFEDALTSQINARSSIQWGTYGPWLIFCVFRAMTVMLSFTAGGDVFGPMTSIFSTLIGNILALSAALISIFVYRHCTNVSQRGLVVKRVVMVEPEESLAASGPMMGQRRMGGQKPENMLSAQSWPAAAN